MFNREQMVAEIAKEVVARLQAHMNGAATTTEQPVPPTGADGIFETVDDAVVAAAAAQEKLAALSLEERGKAISIIRRMCEEKAEEWGRLEMDESGIGRADHKIEKLRIVKYVLGVEAMQSEVRSDASGLCVIERAPWGVIGMVLPATQTLRLLDLGLG